MLGSVASVEYVSGFKGRKKMTALIISVSSAIKVKTSNNLTLGTCENVT